MRWYCVHPSLPLQAELRIRAAPDSSAAERGRISQGRAIAACSPAFQVRSDDAESGAVSWLQVAYVDAASGETEGGFMMATLPDGMALVIPWEETDFIYCCQVNDPTAQLFDRPQETAQCLGTVSTVNFLYCVVEETESRARIFHPELESVWVDKKNLQVVCARLKHEECSTHHTFYELSDALPEEAQIAIREFPSKEAQTVGLLSRGETLEVTVRGGNWLQIAGGSVDKAWIMWRTDALELLQEAPDVCSSTCERVIFNINDRERQPENQLSTSDSCGEEGIDHITTSSDIRSIGQTNTAHGEVGNVQGDTTSSSAAEPVETEEAASVQTAAVWEDRPIRPAPTPLDVQGDTTNSSAAEPVETEEAASVQTSPVWEDRPIRPSPTPLDVQGDTTNSSAAEPVETEEAASVQTAPVWEDRPIRPAPTPLDVQGDTTNSSAAEPVETEEAASVQTAPVWEDRPIRPSPTPLDVQGDTTNSSAAEPVETEEAASVQTAPVWEDRPIRPAPTPLDVQGDTTNSSAAEPVETEEAASVQTAPVWEDRPIRPALTPLDVQGDTTNSSAAEPVETEEAASVQTAPVWEDRPIRPSPTPLDVQGDTTNSSAAGPVETEEAASVQTAPVWEDRPIRPAPTPLDVQGDTTNSSAAEPVETEEAASVQTAPVWEDRPIRPSPTPLDVQGDTTNSSAAEPVETEEAASVQTAPVWEDRPIRPAPTPLDVQGDTTNSSAAEPVETEEAASVQTAPVWEDRPIRPAPTPLDVQGDTTNSSAAEPVETEEAASVQTAPVWEDRPIRPAPTPLDVQGDTTNSSAAEPVETEEAASVQTAPVWEDRPIRPSPTPLDVQGDTTNSSAAEPVETEEAASVQTAPVWEDRPIRPAPTPLDVQGDTTNSSAAEPVETEEAASVQTAPAWEDRPIRSTHTIHGEGDKDDSAVNGLAKIAYSQMLKYRVDCDKQYADHEITSGSESGEIALLGSLEDVFDPVDELLPAMPQEEAKRMDSISLALLSTPLTESMPVGVDATAVERGERSGDRMVLYHAGCAADGNVHAGNGSPTDGLSYLQQVGVGKYCEHKQSLSAAGDELSQAMYEADQDDSDLVFQALVGDAPLSDDWFYVVAVRHHSADPHAIMPTTSAHANVDPKNTYELIMSDALPEEILESELRDNDDGDYDLISLFKYPLPTRRIFERAGSRTSLLKFQQLATPVGSPNTPPVADQSAATISDNQASVEFAFTPTKSALSKTRIGLQKSATGSGSIKKPLGSLARPQSFVGALPVSALAKPARSGLPKSATVVSHISPTQPSRSLLLPRSSLTSGSDATSSSASSIPRKSFGFRRSSFKQ